MLITKAGKFKLKDYTYSQMVSEEQTIEIAFSNKKYLAPEITNMHLISPKNDIYSLGFVLYELMVVSCQPDTNDFTNYPASSFYSKILQQTVNQMLKKDYMLRPSAAEILEGTWDVQKDNMRMFKDNFFSTGYDKENI